MAEDRSDSGERERPPAAREAQRPVGEVRGEEGTWLTGDAEDDPLREEAAERARQAVERPGERE